ncbi:hypothetical protein VTN96DRAFT_741 [Rasamsonia emersonii]
MGLGRPPLTKFSAVSLDPSARQTTPTGESGCRSGTEDGCLATLATLQPAFVNSPVENCVGRLLCLLMQLSRTASNPFVWIDHKNSNGSG